MQQRSVEQGNVVRYAISGITVQSLADLGYLVDTGRADAMPVALSEASPQTSQERGYPVPFAAGPRRANADVWMESLEVFDAHGNVVLQTDSP